MKRTTPISKYNCFIMSEPPLFPKMRHRRRPNPEEATPSPESGNRGKIFSKSRDTREDRGTREMKMSHNEQTFHAR
jgi:hypothetical protein